MGSIIDTRKVKAVLNLDPVSVNNSHGIVHKNGRTFKYKNEKTKSFEKAFSFEFDRYMEDFLKFAAWQNELQCPIHATYIFYLPNCYKQDGIINKRGKDLTNCIKVLEDCIFKAISIDDAFCTEVHAFKKGALLAKVEIELSLIYS